MTSLGQPASDDAIRDGVIKYVLMVQQPKYGINYQITANFVAFFRIL